MLDAYLLDHPIKATDTQSIWDLFQEQISLDKEEIELGINEALKSKDHLSTVNFSYYNL